MTPKPSECASFTNARRSSGVPYSRRGGEEIDAIITPAEFAGEIRDRHHLDHGDSDPGQLCQFLRRRPPRSFLGESADDAFRK